MVWRKWTAATRVKKPKSRSAGVSASEMGRARATVEQLQARVEELEQELAGAYEATPEAPDQSRLLDESCVALTACFRSLGSSVREAEGLLSPDLFAYWREHGQMAKAKLPE